jgi:hypothetical protein
MPPGQRVAPLPDRRARDERLRFAAPAVANVDRRSAPTYGRRQLRGMATPAALIIGVAGRPLRPAMSNCGEARHRNTASIGADWG